MLLLLENSFMRKISPRFVGYSFQFFYQMMERKVALFPTSGFLVGVVELSYAIPFGGVLIT